MAAFRTNPELLLQVGNRHDVATLGAFTPEAFRCFFLFCRGGNDPFFYATKPAALSSRIGLVVAGQSGIKVFKFQRHGLDWMFRKYG